VSISTAVDELSCSQTNRQADRQKNQKQYCCRYHGQKKWSENIVSIFR